MRKILTAKIFLATFVLAGTISASAQTKPSIKNFECPTCHGLTEIAPNVFTDAPKSKNKLLNIVNNSRKTTESFFGRNRSDPKIVMCLDFKCVRIFRKNIGKGHTIGHSYTLLGPTGISQIILTHELVHTEIAKRMSLASPLTMTSETIPTWFNEGLATYLSEDDRYFDTASDADMKFAYGLRNQRIWWKHVNLTSFKRGYSGARTLVAKLDDKMGREKLSKIVDLVAYGGLTFDSIVEPYLQIK